ncbi:hypothetical protein [Hyalangium versicolor]|uniref:hypothetical protein n=1 Tax=Hyalangium versicolor TaxID=2861190 RepID=UPI001CD009DC|nr:hypothetical protein [Hyalangium versicolor]
MKKLMLSALSAAALVLSACGDSERSLNPGSPGLTTTRTPDGVTAGRNFELRLRGTNAEAYASVLVPVRSLEVSTPEGQALPVRLAARTVDLTVKDHAYLVGHFFVPEGVSTVKVKMTFDDFGGWEQGGKAGSLDTQVAPVSFDAPVASLLERGRAVLLLDVSRSLQPTAEAERLLLPTLKVNY